MKKLILSLFLSVFITNMAQASETQNLFTQLMANVSKRLSDYEKGAVTADTLSSGDLRQYLFTIETLANLYRGQYPVFADIGRSIKGLEDEIGAYRKASELLSYAINSGASQQKIDALTTNKQHALKRIESYLHTSGWKNTTTGESVRILELLSNIKWVSDRDDQNYAYHALGQQVDRLAKTPWNMSVLEGGTGIHDLRKDVRWYRLNVSALGHILGTQNNSCQQGVVHPQAANGAGKCLISACLHNRMLTAYEILGNIKDEGEGQEGVGGHLNPERFKEAKDLYDSLRQEQIFEKLTEEILSCKLK